MKLTDIIDHVLLETGEFIVGDISLIHFDIKRFWLLVKRSLLYYQKHKFITRKFQIYIPSSPYTFSQEDKPKWISKVYPTGIASNFWFMNAASYAGGDLIPVVFRYDDDTGKLYVANVTEAEITAHYNYKVVLEYDQTDTTKLINVDLPEIDESHEKLLTHIKGSFMLALGRSRRAFTAQDFPIQMDSNELVSEGTQIIQEIETSISETNDWYYSIGG